MPTIDPDDRSEIARARLFNDRLVERALSMNGTSTGEHGIGMGKRDKLIQELGMETVAVMQAIKSAIDGKGLMNPDKVFAL